MDVYVTMFPVVESSEVQTVYFRLQTKGGDWVWLTSRGKVISKNSKKFSIAFSHCPLRWVPMLNFASFVLKRVKS